MVGTAATSQKRPPEPRRGLHIRTLQVQVERCRQKERTNHNRKGYVVALARGRFRKCRTAISNNAITQSAVTPSQK
jgi:hypothetical protein